MPTKLKRDLSEDETDWCCNGEEYDRYDENAFANIYPEVCGRENDVCTNDSLNNAWKNDPDNFDRQGYCCSDLLDKGKLNDNNKSHCCTVNSFFSQNTDICGTCSTNWHPTKECCTKEYVGDNQSRRDQCCQNTKQFCATCNENPKYWNVDCCKENEDQITDKNHRCCKFDEYKGFGGVCNKLIIVYIEEARPGYANNYYNITLYEFDHKATGGRGKRAVAPVDITITVHDTSYLSCRATCDTRQYGCHPTTSCSENAIKSTVLKDLPYTYSPTGRNGFGGFEIKVDNSATIKKGESQTSLYPSSKAYVYNMTDAEYNSILKITGGNVLGYSSPSTGHDRYFLPLTSDNYGQSLDVSPIPGYDIRVQVYSTGAGKARTCNEFNESTGSGMCSY